MKTIYEQPVRALLVKMIDDLAPDFGVVFTRDQAIRWFMQHYPKINPRTVMMHLTRFSTNAPGRIHHTNSDPAENLLFQIDARQFRRYNPKIDPPPIGPGRTTLPPKELASTDIAESDNSPLGRLDTTLESAGAEFLVLGNLLLHRIPAYKTYTNMPGFDLVATNAEMHTSARIQVKSRWETGSSGFPISNFDCDFVVAAFLNRGSKDGKKKISDPMFYIFPIELFLKLPRRDRWNKVYRRDVPNAEFYRDKWELIVKFLGGPTSDG